MPSKDRGRKAKSVVVGSDLQSINKTLSPMEHAKNLISRKKYKEATTWLKSALKLFPNLKDALEMLIISESLYHSSITTPNYGIDWYSVLHLRPSATDTEVNTHCEILTTCTKLMEIEGFPGAVEALGVLNQGVSVLCDKPKRLEFDCKRKECGLVNMSIATKKSCFRDDYITWKPPVAGCGDTGQVHFLKRAAPTPESVFDGEIALSLEMKKLKTQLFDEMPQRPHYAPLEKYNRNLRRGMMIGLDIAFIELCVEIQRLEDPQRFGDGVDEFRKELKEMEEMGYDTDKVRERLESLERIVGFRGSLLDQVEKLKTETKEYETMIKDMTSRVLELKAEIEESNVFLEKHVKKIDVLKKETVAIVEEFASTAKSTWK